MTLRSCSPVPVLIAATALVFFVFTACNGELRFDEHSLRADAAADAGGDAPAVPLSDGGSDEVAPRAPCTDDTACNGTRCDVANGVCVACLADSDCSGALRRCEKDLHVCVACRELSDCGGLLHRCEPVTHRCIDGCFDDDDACPTAGFVCEKSVLACIECRKNANCAGHPAGSICDKDVGRCVECISNAQCPSERPACDRRTGKCAGCVSSIACGPGRLCDPLTLVCRDP